MMTNTPPRPGRLMASFNLQGGEPQTVAVPWSRAGLLRGMAERQGQQLRQLTSHLKKD